jgi:integrase
VSGQGNTMGAMPRPGIGTIIRNQTRLGTSYSLRFSYRGEKVYHYVGGSWEGWTEERVEAERVHVMGQVQRGEYVPPQPAAAPAPAGDEVPTFQVFASIVLARKKRRVAEKTYKDLEWRLTTAMDHFGSYRVDEIDAGAADDFVEKKLVEREAIEKAAAAGKPLKEGYTDPRTGRTHQRRRRPLSNDSINKVLAGVRQVLKEAKRRRLIDHNPLDDRECYLRSGAPTRSFLEVPQITAVLDAARQLDQEQRPLDWRDVRAIRGSEEPATRLAARYGVSDTLIRRIRRREIWTEDRPREAGRLPVVATLLLAGPRILELSRLDRPDLDLAAREIRMPRVKTAASERTVPMLPTLHEILLTQSADRPSHKGPAFATRNGTRQHPDNVRSRLLAGVLERANVLLADAGEQPITYMTPHTLRRTFASLLAEIGVSPRRAMYLLGHTDPKFTMRVYQQVLDLGGSAPERLELVLGCTVDEAFSLLSGRELRTPSRSGKRSTASSR